MFVRVAICWLVMVLALGGLRSLTAQTPEEPVASTAAADKFLELFLARPQPGTALEKTVEHYQSIGELDRLIERLEAQAKEAQGTQPETAARRWLAAALIAQSQSRWLESIELLRQAPDVPLLQWEIGKAQSVAFEQLQRWSSIIDVLQPLVEKSLQDSAQGKSTALIDVAQRLAKAYSRAGRTGEALKTWQAIENRFGGDQQIAMRLASMAASEGELTFAIEVLDRILAKLPPSTKRVELAMQRTSLVARQGDERSAIAQYQEMLRGLNVDSWLATEITHRLEDLIIAKDGTDALINHYRTRLTQQPDDIQVMLRLASWLDSEKRWEESSELFQRAIERTTIAIEPRSAYAQSLLRQERWHEASLQFEKLAALAPRDDDVVMQWCEAILADTTVETSARDNQVQKILERSLDGLDPSAANYRQMAARQQRFGQSERAVFWLSKAYALQPNDLSILSDYARAMVDLGQEEPVLKILAEYEQSHQQHRPELAQLADLYADLDQKALAIACLTRACELGASTAMRFRLADWLENADRAPDAFAQLEQAWLELPKQTGAISEQESLCEEITRRQLKLAAQLDNLPEIISRLRMATGSQKDVVSLAGLSADSLAAWRLAKFLAANTEWAQAAEHVAKALEPSPNSPMLWRLQAEIDEHNNRLAEAITARRKLAELDVRRRSEYLLQAAKDLARMGNLAAALQLTESITTETASSQNIIAVFDLASEHGATKFSIELLNRRHQVRPGDQEVLARLIKFYVDNGNLARAAEYQWKMLELKTTPEQRQAAVQMLIETYSQLRSLDALEKKLDKFWRQHDLWREFGVWQVMIALRSNDQLQAEKLLDRLAQSHSTRRFALENAMKLAKMRNQSSKLLQLMKQMASIDPQAVTADELAKVLSQVAADDREDQMAKDAVTMMHGPGKRLALVHELLLAGQVDWALRLVNALPEREQNSWPIVSRTALALAACTKNQNPLTAHNQHAQALLQKYVEQPLELPETLVGESLLAELLGSQTLIVEFLATSAAYQSFSQGVGSIPGEALNCSSRLQAYAAVIAAQLQFVTTPEQRRGVIDMHRRIAMNQPNMAERSVRLAALAVTCYWQSKTATVKEALAALQSTLRKNVNDELAVHLRMQIRKFTYAKLPAPKSSLTTHLAGCSEGLSHVIVPLSELAEQGDPLSALLCLWELSLHEQGLVKARQADALKRAMHLCRNLKEYEPFAPAQIVALMAIAGMSENSEESKKPLESLSRLSLSRQELQKLIELILVHDDPDLIEALVASQLSKAPMADLLGELLCSRTRDQAFSSLSVLRALDCIWKCETERGLRNLAHLKLDVTSANSPWMQWLPICSVPIHESSLLKQIDFALLRAVLANSSSNASRQELLKFFKQVASEPANDDLRLVRQLAQVFVFEFLEQDAQSTKLLDEILPESCIDNPKLAVLRGQWLDLTGRRDAAIAWWVKIDQLPEEIRERSAATLLKLAIDRHDDEATEFAIKQLRAATRNLTAYRDLAGELLRRDKLAQAESLIGEFKVLLPPTAQSLVLAPSKPTTVIQSPSMDESLISRWQQTDQLFVLLRKYSQSDDVVGACRIARRLLTGAKHASEEELVEHLPNLVNRLSHSFDKAEHLRKFLELESTRLQEQDAPSEALCVLRMIAQEKLPQLSEPIIRRQVAVPTNAAQNFELAQSVMDLGDHEAAAKLYARGFELGPVWLETSIKNISTSPKTLVLLAKELNDLPQACTWVGTATMDAFFKVIPDRELQNYPTLLKGWASSTRPKSQLHMRWILARILKDDFDLWLNIVEQLLVADELQPMVLAYESDNLWTQTSYQPGFIEQLLMDTKFSPEQDAAYQEMLQRVLVRSRDNFVARLLLMRRLIASKQFDHATEQLPFLLQGSLGRSPTKTWVITEWRMELAKSLAKNPVQADTALRQLSGNKASTEIDAAAKAKLLLHLVSGMQDRPQENELRTPVVERIAELGGMAMLDSVQRATLLKFYVEKHDEAKVLALFEAEFQRLAAPANRRIENAYASSTSTWSLLANSGMGWVRHVVLVRLAQIEQVPVAQSSMARAKLAVDAGDSPEIVYPLKKPDVDALKVYVAKSRQYLSNLRGAINQTDTWVEAFKPHVILDVSKQKIEIVSMLDAIWPLGQPLTDQDARKYLQGEVQSWSKELDTLGPWATLALHNLAARLGEGRIVEQAQTHLLQLTTNKALPDEKAWGVACWSAAEASAAIPEAARLRFRVGELARQAVLDRNRPQNELYVLMTIEQFDRTSNDGVRSTEETKLVEAMAKDVLDMIKGRSTPSPLSIKYAASSRFTIHVKMLEKLMARDEKDVAIELLRAMQQSNMVYGTARGIVPYDGTRHGQTFNVHMARTLPLLQRLVDSNEQSQNLLNLWQELLLAPLDLSMVGMGGMGSAGAFPSSSWQSTTQSVAWDEAFDPLQPLGPQTIPSNMFSQLVHLAQINGSEVQLQSSFTNFANTPKQRVGAYVCGVILALEAKDLPQAIDLYSSALFHSDKMVVSRDEFELMSKLIFNAVRLAPLADPAIEFSVVALRGPITDENVRLLRQQLQLAARQKNFKTTEAIVASLGKAVHMPVELRARLRDEYSIALLNAGLATASMEAYSQLRSKERPQTSDRYVLELMNRLPLLDAGSQAELFNCFVKQKHPHFPWLECYPLPMNESLPKRFRRADLSEGLIFQSLDNQRSWVSLLPWIADYAERSNQTAEVLESSSFIGVDNAQWSWGAAALAARLNPDLTPGALKNRLELARQSATPAAMRALLDCCQHNELLRSAAIEFILNIGYTEIALGASSRGTQMSRPELTKTEQPANAWQHWLTVRESTLSQADGERPRWSLAKSGQWNAQAAKEPWYLMLRYPIEGDFQLSLTAQQVSGTKFGIGYGGLALAQSVSDKALRRLGVAGRRATDLVYSPSSEESDIVLKVERRGSQWALHAASVSLDENAPDPVPFVYLVNQGEGVARMTDWQLAGDLKIARHANLVDAQMRLWRASLGRYKLPNLKVRSSGNDTTTSSKDVNVNASELNLTVPKESGNSTDDQLNAIHCIRPLQSGETISYEFYQAADSAPVHPALGRMVFRLDHDQVKLQWLMHSNETDWLGIPSAKLYAIEAQENIANLKCKTDAWNAVRLTLTADNQVAIELNGELVARVPLPTEVIPEFGLVVSQATAAKVRDVHLSGPWPQSLSLEELTRP